jgi:hypothetical protein
MLPFTTYSIPESNKSGIPKNEKWLCLIVDQALSDTDKDLLFKISSALKADFDRDVFCFHDDPSDKNSSPGTDLSGMKLIISFGLSPSVAGIWIDLPSPGLRILESCSIIRTVPLKVLHGSAPAKKDLWSAMQEYTASQNHG